MRGLLWSHLLASVLGGIVVAGILLGFGVIGKQRTETVATNTPSPQTQAGASPDTSNEQNIYNSENEGVVYIKALLTQRVDSPFMLAPEPRGSLSTGSGFLITASGYILTSYHVIAGADPARGITVVFNDDISRRATLTQANVADDVALLKVDMHGVPSVIQPLTLGDSQSVNVGEPTLTIANPFGLDRTLSTGIVSALQRHLVGADGSIDSVIQTDTPLSPGASGSPLLDATDGSVIGVNSQIAVADGGHSYAIGFAVPIGTVRQSIIPKGVLPG